MRRRGWILAAALLCAGLAASAQGASRGISVVKGASSLQALPGGGGKRYAVCIGINNYEDADIKDLAKARNDARGLGEALKGVGQFDSVFVMSDEVDPRFDAQRSYPRLANIRARLAYLADFIEPGDLVVLSFSGHGIADDKGESYLVAADTRNADPFATSLPLREVVAWLQKLKVRRSLLLIDACRETVSTRASRSLGGGGGLRSDRFESAEVSAVFYATRNGWYSYEDDETDYGVFTRYVLEGVKGKADYQYGNRDGLVTFRELAGFVEDAVSGYALARGLKQRPYTRILDEASGDLALSTYSASVDVGTRAVVGSAAPGGTGGGSGAGSVRVFSNVPGELRLDGMDRGRVTGGRRVVLEDLQAGPHFLEIAHELGLFRKEILVESGSTLEVMNLALGNAREPRRIGDATFVWVAGSGGRPGFWLGESEVTFGQFAEFAERTRYEAKGSWRQHYKPAFAFYPVINVTWEDCAAYAAWFARRAGVKASLPTLAQRQAAAAGPDGAGYPWGDDWEDDYCHWGESDAPGMLPVVGRRGPVQVQQIGMDMTIGGAAHLAGNVREWCADRRSSSDGAAELAAAAGGSWLLGRPRSFTASYAEYLPAYSDQEDLGFRLAIAGD